MPVTFVMDGFTATRLKSVKADLSPRVLNPKRLVLIHPVVTFLKIHQQCVRRLLPLFISNSVCCLKTEVWVFTVVCSRKLCLRGADFPASYGGNTDLSSDRKIRTKWSHIHDHVDKYISQNLYFFFLHKKSNKIIEGIMINWIFLGFLIATKWFSQ